MAIKIKGNLLTYTKGMTTEKLILHFRSRIEKREKEIEKREWIVKEYNSLVEKNKVDRGWLVWLEKELEKEKQSEVKENE